jgi:hypothetical protein
MGSPASRTIHGFFVGTGATLTIETKIGFRPRRVDLFNISADPAMAVHYEGMPAASVYKQKGGTTSLTSSLGITLTDTGFTLGADTDLNVDGEQVAYTVYP